MSKAMWVEWVAAAAMLVAWVACCLRAGAVGLTGEERAEELLSFEREF